VARVSRMERDKRAARPDPADNAPARGMVLGPDDVHVWWLDPAVSNDARCHARCWDVLSADERQRHERLRVESSRQQYLVSHAFLRLTLSRYASVTPEEWTFTTNRHGRPEIARPSGGAPLRFNLSHTHGLVVCGVTLQRDLGVDVEEIRGRPRHVDIARRFFAPAEVAALLATPSDQQSRRFFEYWTLKESYIKARGLGLSLPLRQFAFDLSARPRVRVSFDTTLNDDAVAWDFASLWPTPAHVLAVAAKRQAGRAVVIRQMGSVPSDLFY
jgi:4'-phosphopantetheinyl transferase